MKYCHGLYIQTKETENIIEKTTVDLENQSIMKSLMRTNEIDIYKATIGDYRYSIFYPAYECEEEYDYVSLIRMKGDEIVDAIYGNAFFLNERKQSLTEEEIDNLYEHLYDFEDTEGNIMRKVAIEYI